MKRLFPLFALVLVVACNKPSDEMCRKAIRNMRSLMGTDSPTNMTDIEGDVRRCKGGSTKKAVECAAKATTLDELRACDFMKIPTKAGGSAEPAGSSSTSGSAPTGSGTTTGSAGSTMTSGSAAGDSAGGGSAMGSAAGGSAGGGSAAGSAAAGSGSTMGSAAAGSAMGSAAGSAAK